MKSLYCVKALGIVVTVTGVVLLLCTAPAGAFLSNKLVFDGQFGWNVNKTKVESGGTQAEKNVCTETAGIECQTGSANSGPGGFNFAEGVAVGPSGNVYVGADNNNRIDEFTAEGQFIRMFGWNVNKTKVESGGTQAEKNVCTETAGIECKAGEAGGRAGQFHEPASIAIDQTTGNLYVVDLVNWRIDEYGENGDFISMFGLEVNETKDNAVGATSEEKDICTALSGNVCKAGVRSAVGSTVPGAFKFKQGVGNLLSIADVGAPAKLVLYVGDEERIQEFSMDGKPVGQVSLASFASEGTVRSLAVSPSEEIYVVYHDINGKGGTYVHVLNGAGVQVREIDPTGNVAAVALDPFGRLAVIDSRHGMLFEAASGKKLSEFEPPVGMGPTVGLAFNPSPVGGDELYAVDQGHQDIEFYAPVPVADLVTVSPCGNITSESLALKGEVNPLNVKGTVAWFEYGTSQTLGLTTPLQDIADGNSLVSVEAGLSGLLPNQQYFYRVAGEDENALSKGGPGKEPQLVAEETRSCKTLVLPPAVPGPPVSYLVGRFSAVLSATVNPEHAKTLYKFQYGQCAELDGCSTRKETPDLKSANFGLLGVMQTATELAPGAKYRYRLVATNEYETTTEGEEAEFTTLPAPHQVATTGAPDGITASATTLKGTVDPDGVSATYSFQMGIYNGANTVFGTVVSGPTGTLSAAESEMFVVAGLQPGTSYEYRMVVSSAYGTSFGAPVIFTTAGQPEVITPPANVALLAVPSIAFPKQATKLKSKKVRQPPKRKKKSGRKNGHKARRPTTKGRGVASKK